MWLEGMEFAKQATELARQCEGLPDCGLAADIRDSAMDVPLQVAKAAASTTLTNRARCLLSARQAAYEAKTRLEILERLEIPIDGDQCRETLEALIDKLWRLTRAGSEMPVSLN